MKINIYIFLSFLLFLGVSCETPFDELNTDPTSLTEVELRLMLPEAQTQSMFNEGNGGNRAIGIIMQQFIGLDAQQLQYTDYVLGEDLLNNYWSTGLYSGVLRSCDDIIRRSTDQGATFYSGVAKIITANQYGIATSWFGDIPLSEALKGADNLKPGYDAQEVVYASLLAMLDDGIADLALENGGYGGGDLIYDGDAASWIKTARGLKARFLMHQAKRNPSNYAAALTEIDASYASAAEQSNFTFGTSNTQNYSLAKFAAERPSTLGIDARFAAMMDGDPRQALYMEEVDGTWLFDTAGRTWSTNDATVPMLSYSELMFMKAEIANQMGGDASTPLTNAIVSSCVQAGVEEADAMAYAATVTAGTINLETIMLEAYKGYYGYAFHTTWSNWRRTGIPSLTPSSNGQNGFNPSGGVPVRFLYAESESQTNSANVEAAKANQGGGLLDASIWAYQ